MVAAVILAAGASSRFGAPKQQLLLEPVLERVRASAVDEVVVVTGAHDVETDARTVHCSEWERGPGASLRCGLASLPPAVRAAVVVLADGPDLDPRALDAVIERWTATSEPVVAASYDGQRLHPVLLARDVWDRIPDEGARALPAAVVDCSHLSPPGDVDFADDLPRRLRPGRAEP
jgi:nicotine blue oxidoreductase